MLLLILIVYPITEPCCRPMSCLAESQTPTETDSNLWGGQSYKWRRQPSLGLEQVPETETASRVVLW